jgi:CBS domain-containing protein
MKVNDVMSVKVKLAHADDTLRSVARSMAEIDTGVLPVGENDRLIGIITDRDIVLRAVSQGLDPDNTRARDVMSPQVHYCYANDDIEEIARTMGELQVRRLPVLNEHQRLVGIVSIGDIAQNMEPTTIAETLESISGP